MRGIFTLVVIAIEVFILAGTFSCWEDRAMDKKSQARDQVYKWKIHDPDRPQPSVVNPGPAGSPVPPPSDAVVLFDGKDLSQWDIKNVLPTRPIRINYPFYSKIMAILSATGISGYGSCQRRRNNRVIQ